MQDERNTIIDYRHLAEIIPLSRSQVWRLEKAGEFPSRVKIGRRKVGWLLSEIMEWLNTRERVFKPPDGRGRPDTGFSNHKPKGKDHG